ncbi:MAG: DUF1800 family protein [Planctomycetota bacterium]
MAFAAPALAAPVLTQTLGTPWPTAPHALEFREIASTGPMTVEPNADPTKGYLVIFEFNEPILGAKGAAASNASVASLQVVEADGLVLVELADIQDQSYITVNIDKVASASGVFPNVTTTIGFLKGDVTGDRVVDAADLVPLLAAPDGARELFKLGIGHDGALPGATPDPRALPDLPPLLTETETMHAAPGQTSLPKTFTIRDDRLNEEELFLIAASTNPAVLPSENIQLLGSGGIRTVLFQAPAGVSGACTLQIYAVDESGVGLLQIPVIIKPDEAPDARFSVDHHVGQAPLTVRLDAGSTTDILENVAGYAWDLGDGSTAIGLETTHTFTQPGVYDVTLTAVDASGLVATETRTVTVASGATSDGGLITEQEARRFLWQAAFGPTEQSIADVMSMGYENWIDAQLALPATEMLYSDLQLGQSLGYNDTFPGWTFDDIAVEAPDQLRQRMAWALIQIIVMNHLQDESSDEAACVYYTQYIQHALGNYRDLLEYVTFSYPMASYLTYRFSSKANPITGSVPDENYAREIQQLFSMGLWALDPDGQRSQDVFGDDIPNYDNDDIREFARVFTGLRFGGSDLVPLGYALFDHDYGLKQLHDYPGAVPLEGVIPASFTFPQNIELDVQLAIENVFHHPSTPAYLAELLIKRLTSSNPTPAYVGRVADAFRGVGPHGTGARGDLAAVAKAILLDPEARDPEYRSNPYVGKVIEPQILHYGLYRTLARVDRPSESFPFRINANVYLPFFSMRQGFMLAPSVFNYYNPDDAPIGSEMDRGGLTLPELRIHDDLTAIEAPNIWMFEVIAPEGDERSPFYDQWLGDTRNAPDVDAALVDAAADHMLCEPLSAEARDIIIDAVRSMSGNLDKVQAAVSLIALSPEFTVLK